MKTELLSAFVDEEVLRAAALRQVVGLARRRRRVRHARRALAGGCVLMVAVGLFLHSMNPIPEGAGREMTASSAEARPIPVLAPQRIRTESNLFTRVASSSSGLTRIESKGDLFVAVETGATAPKLRLLSDRQLVAAFPQRPPALIAPGTGEVRLVFW